VSQHRFNVYGRLVTIEGTQGSWSAFCPSPDGKRVLADFIVPNFLAEDELCQYLADLFHESATPGNGDVFPLPLPVPKASPGSRAHAERMIAGTEGYEEDAELLIERYESTPFVEKHQAILDLLPTGPGSVLDIGSGTGLDAAWLADQGHAVLAVEPTEVFRRAAAIRHPSTRIEWLADSLPGLHETMRRRQTFDLIMITAVWMHLDREQREQAMPRVAALLRRGARLVMALRHGPIPANRRMFEVTADETAELARQQGLSVLRSVRTESAQLHNRQAGITWSRLVCQR
jgi:SAM-dependent methyltransferase